MAYIYQPERLLLAEQISKAAKYVVGRVLDIGAGDYSRYRHFFHCGQYLKMDVAKSDNIDVVGSAEAIPFKDGQFDSLVSTQVLEHLKHPAVAVKEMARVLKTGGFALVTAPQWNELHSEPYDFWRFTSYGLKLLFEENGFKTILCEERGGYHSMRLQMAIRHKIDLWQLYKRPILGRVLSFVFALQGKVAIWRDSRDKSLANTKHAIGWCAIFQKK